MKTVNARYEFVVLPVENANLLLRMDTKTGRTLILRREPFRWEEVLTEREYARRATGRAACRR